MSTSVAANQVLKLPGSEFLSCVDQLAFWWAALGLRLVRPCCSALEAKGTVLPSALLKAINSVNIFLTCLVSWQTTQQIQQTQTLAQKDVAVSPGPCCYCHIWVFSAVCFTPWLQDTGDSCQPCSLKTDCNSAAAIPWTWVASSNFERSTCTLVQEVRGIVERAIAIKAHLLFKKTKTLKQQPN